MKPQVDGEANADADKAAFLLMSDFLNQILDPSSGGGMRDVEQCRAAFSRI
jgi:hypothetical protein